MYFKYNKIKRSDKFSRRQFKHFERTFERFSEMLKHSAKVFETGCAESAKHFLKAFECSMNR